MYMVMCGHTKKSCEKDFIYLLIILKAEKANNKKNIPTCLGKTFYAARIPLDDYRDNTF